MGNSWTFAWAAGFAIATSGCSDSCSVNLAGNYTIAGCASGSCTITQQMGQCGFSASCDGGINCSGKVSGSSSISLSCNTGFGTYSGSGSINSSGVWSVMLSGGGTSCNVIVTPVPGHDGGAGNGGAGGAGGTGGMPDAAPLCTSANQRVCLSQAQSGHCDSTLNAVADRNCPTGSTCMDGYCQPPGGAAACTSTNNCNALLVCALYSNSTHTGLVGFCSNPRPGGAGLYANCTSDRDCGSDFCAMRSGGLLECAEPCSGTSGTACPGAATNCRPIASPTTIEGIATAGQLACLQ